MTSPSSMKREHAESEHASNAGQPQELEGILPHDPILNDQPALTIKNTADVQAPDLIGKIQ